MTITTEFELKQPVHIRELNINGRVMAFLIDDKDATVQYSVRYFYDGKSQAAYFFFDQLNADLPNKGTPLASSES